MKKPSQHKAATFGDLIVAVYDACGQRRARSILRFAVNSRLVVFPRRAIRVIGLVLAVGLLPAVWTGCASTRTRESTGEYLDNSTITAKVKTALAKDPIVSALRVHVKSFKGTVQLSGFVNTQAEKDRAEEIARGVNGVESVTNSLIVKSD